MTTFWSWYITLLTVGSLVALFWLIFATRKSEVHKNPTEQTMGHAFDGIEEYDNPLPKWWFMLFLGTLVFSVGYLLLYPGLGNFKGLLPGYEDGWTQVNQWQREMDRADELYGPIFAKYAAMPIEEVAKDERAEDGRTPVRLQLLGLPWLRRQGQLRLPQPDGQQLALGWRAGDHQDLHHAWPRRRDACTRPDDRRRWCT